MVLDPDHEEIATSHCNLAKLRLAEQDPAAAQPSVERCIAIREEKLGPEHPYYASALEIYAEVLNELGDSDAASEMEQQAEAIRAATAR